MTDAQHRFFLQAIDPDHGCPVLEAVVHVGLLDDLRALLGQCADDDPALCRRYPIDGALLAAISQRFGVALDPGGREVRLVSWHSLREVPYLVHTNYELPLMLEGRKQFARMCESYPPFCHHEEDCFDRYVREGLLHKEVSFEPFDSPQQLKDGGVIEGHREVYYTRKGEEWRIQAWKLISAASRKSGWNESFERLEGMLYGYEEWQMDWWITHLRERMVFSATNV
jgi:hypothetical protein